ncbi:hypothetical protein JTB14_027222 [Gonioctena quinquepunctata]|nr:hypothetical protein JTB14_027222 [Gonioctena quinquepunctata]
MENSFEENKFIIIGDFILSQLQEFYVTGNQTNLIRRFVDFLNFGDLVQWNSIKNINDRLLDLVICATESTCVVKNNEDPLVPLDPHHPGLLIQLSNDSVSYKKIPTIIKRYDMERVDVQKFSRFLCEINWTQLLSYRNDVDTMCETFNDIVQKMIPE